VITDDSSKAVFNLLQQDMLAMRVTSRLGWALPNPANMLQGIKLCRSAEIDAINGIISQYAKDMGLATPCDYLLT
jgi:ketopantoate reductase